MKAKKKCHGDKAVSSLRYHLVESTIDILDRLDISWFNTTRSFIAVNTQFKHFSDFELTKDVTYPLSSVFNSFFQEKNYRDGPVLKNISYSAAVTNIYQKRKSYSIHTHTQKYIVQVYNYILIICITQTDTAQVLEIGFVGLITQHIFGQIYKIPDVIRRISSNTWRNTDHLVIFCKGIAF